MTWQEQTLLDMGVPPPPIKFLKDWENTENIIYLVSKVIDKVNVLLSKLIVGWMTWQLNGYIVGVKLIPQSVLRWGFIKLERGIGWNKQDQYQYWYQWPGWWDGRNVFSFAAETNLVELVILYFRQEKLN